MSIEDLYAYIQGESQAVEKILQYPAGAGLVYIMDENRVRMAGDNVVIWDAVTGGVQLVEDTDYTLGHIDAELTTLEGRTIYGGYQIINVAYQGVNLYIDADMIGGYTTRPYRPTYTNITADYTTAPSSVDDSIFADSESNPIAVTLADGTYINQRFAIACTGLNNVTVSGTGLEATAYNNIAVQFIWNGTGWLQLGGAGGGDSAGNLSIGMMAWFPGSGQIPYDKLEANGDLVNILDYQGLYGKYGILYGGDGITTFGLPNMQGITPGAFGTQDINGRTKGDATAIGGVREDHFQDHYHAQRIGTGATNANNSGTSGTFASARDANGDNLRHTVGGVTNNVMGRGAVSGSTAGDPRTGEYTRATELVGRWLIQAFDTVQEVPGEPSLIKDWVEVYGPTHGDLPASEITNQWGEGLYYAGISYIYNGTEERSNGILAILMDGIHREVLFDFDQAQQDSTIKFIHDDQGIFTIGETGSDFSNEVITAIYRWGDVASGQLNPPVDGWETVFNDPANVGPVTNQWGVGEYSVYVKGVSVGNDFTTKIDVDQLTDEIRTGSLSTGSVSASFVYVRHSGGTFNLNDNSTLSDGEIVKIKKFNSLVNVVHTDGNGIIQDEEINGQWVTRWAGGRMEITTQTALTAIDVDIASGAVFRNDSSLSNALILFSVPFLPGTVPVKSFNIYGGNANNFSMRTGSGQSDNEGTSVLIYRTVSATAIGFTIDLIATGRWK